MRRAVFLATLAATSVRPARAQGVDVTPLVARFPGIVGIYARTLSGPPVVAVRPNEPFAAASVVKLGIMLTAFRAYDAGTARPEDRVRLRPDDLVGGSDVLKAAPAGATYSLETLVDAMISRSDNTASNALITAFGFAAINGAISDAGMPATRLARHFADVVPPWRRNLNVTTPRDIGTLLHAIARGAHEGLDTVARTSSCRAMVRLMLRQAYRDMIPAGIKRKVPIANKTGELERVRNDAAIVDPFGESPYVLVVLSRDDDGDAGVRAAIAGIAHRVDSALRAG